MIRGIIPVALLVLMQGAAVGAQSLPKVHPNAIEICSVIINELTEGKVSRKQGEAISLAIAQAGNKHFGRVTCGDMWLYLAMAHQESGFRNNIINQQSCLGMFQIHGPSWASKFGVTYRDLLDVETNADCGVRVFKYYLNLYRNVTFALSAYNSDHPRAALGYSMSVRGLRTRIKKRYTQLYRVFQEADRAPDNPRPPQNSQHAASAQLAGKDALR